MGWCGHKEPVDGCRRCGLAAARSDYRALWGLPEPVAPQGVTANGLAARGISKTKPRLTFNQLADMRH